MSLDVLAGTEEKIQTEVRTKRIRVSEFFKDFDRLRSGCITESQFKRCLNQKLGVTLNEDEIDQLIQKYSVPKTKMVNYRGFSETIDQNFKASKLNENPASQRIEPLEYLGTKKTIKPTVAEVSNRVKDILQKVQNYYTYHGINIRTSYEDFDNHHNGLVTASQFARSFPGPPDITDDEIALLCEQYKDPAKPGLINYLNFHHDVEEVKDIATFEKLTFLSSGSQQDSTQFFENLQDLTPDLRTIFEKIRVAVFKSGIRTPEFFRDHDKLRSGIITENQFICGLSLACGKEAHLTKQEIQKVAVHYKTPDNRVQYKDFCDIMENTFNVPGLEKQPTVHPIRPPRGALTRNLASISPEQEERIEMIISHIRKDVQKRRLMIYPYFRDYDRGVCYTRNVTKSQFARIMHFLSLTVSHEDTALLCRKFEEPISGDVNYPAFCQAVDQEFKHYTIDKASEEPSLKYTPEMPPRLIDTSSVDLNEVINRIKHHTLINRVRVVGFFEDFDTLRSGSISRAIFTRGLNMMGIENITKTQLEALLNTYADPKKRDCVLWTRFAEDIESVFTKQNLEKNPTETVKPLESFTLPRLGSCTSWGSAPDYVQQTFDEAMTRMHSRANQRRLLAKPVFQDFDKHNNGHVTKAQFRQCLIYLNLHADEQEMRSIEYKFMDDIGFNYIEFLGELEPKERQIPKYPRHLKELQMVNAKKKPPEIDALTDFNCIITKIKTKVSKERMRLYEFMKDYDKLRTGRILLSNFRRSIDLAGLALQESEVQILENAYQSYGYPDFVDYLRFQEEIETAFTIKHLDKNPLVEPIQFKPPVEWQQNNLSSEGEIVFKKAMERVAEVVRKTRTQLFPLFEDYDRVHNGTVSQSQFHRVLSELELGSLLSEQEFRVIFGKFKVRIGGKDDVNYIAFCDTVYELARIDPFKP